MMLCSTVLVTKLLAEFMGYINLIVLYCKHNSPACGIIIDWTLTT